MRFIFNIVFITLMVSLDAFGQSNKVVVIPLEGEDTRWQGAWVDGRAYVASDVVSYKGSSYLALAPHTASLETNAPPSSFWDIIAARGAEGPQGPAGIASINIVRRSGIPPANSRTTISCASGEIAISCGFNKSNAGEEDVMGCYTQYSGAISSCVVWHDENGGTDSGRIGYCNCLTLPSNTPD